MMPGLTARLLRFAVLTVLLLAPAGCAHREPTLRALRVDRVPLPADVLQEYLWNRAPALVLTARRETTGGDDTIQVQVRALTDGRVVSFLIVWPDNVESLERAAWLWSVERERFELYTQDVDLCAVMWPLSESADFDPFTVRPSVYDIWLWQAGWSDFSGYADDYRLEIGPAGEDEASTGEREVYFARDRRTRIAANWIPDPGIPGTVFAERPRYRREDYVPGAAVARPTRSQRDVLVRSLYNIFRAGRVNTWFKTGGRSRVGSWFAGGTQAYEQGYWLVEIYRELTTPDKENDYQISGEGPHRFAIVIGDAGPWHLAYRTQPIRLVLPPNPYEGL